MSTHPNLIIIGAMKCGTTSLHNYLNEHEDIFMSKIKELNFFIENGTWSKGLDWYKSNFSASHRINGESSQNYTKRQSNPDSAQKIYDTIPDAKLIYIVRDPIKRIASHFKDIKTYGYIDHDYDINEVVNQNIKHPVFLTSHYYYQIEPYINLFPREQIHFMKLEDLQANPLNELNRVFEFLGVDIWNEIPLLEKLNSSVEKKVETRLLKQLKQNPLIRIVKRCISLNLKNAIINKLSSTESHTSNQLNQESIKLLRASLEKDAVKFQSLTEISYL